MAEHAEIEQGLARLESFTDTQDYATVAATLEEPDRLFRQHVPYGEAQVLRPLIDASATS
jgi:hypothetical protein